VLGRDFRVTRRRGEFITLPSGVEATATIHPSAVLRAENRENAFAGFVDDLRAVAKRLEPPKKVRKA
jgi:uracil-DNA glycosylase